jgi:hypothetical protein
VRAAAGEAVEVERKARDERLALAGLHLGDVALVEDDPAHELHVEHALVRRALAGLADGGERLEDESSSASPFSSRCRNPAVFPWRSAADSCSNSGSSEVT